MDSILNLRLPFSFLTLLTGFAPFTALSASAEEVFFYCLPEMSMKTIFGKTTAWFLWANLTVLIALSLSCCKSSDEGPAPKADDPGASEAVEGSVFPASAVKAIEDGKKMKKLVVIEVYDHECNYCVMMDGSLSNETVISKLGDVIYCRITIESKEVIDEFGITQSPTWLFFANGEYLEPYITGFRSPNVFVAEVNNYQLVMQGKDELAVPDDPHPDYGKG